MFNKMHWSCLISGLFLHSCDVNIIEQIACISWYDHVGSAIYIISILEDGGIKYVVSKFGRSNNYPTIVQLWVNKYLVPVTRMIGNISFKMFTTVGESL